MDARPEYRTASELGDGIGEDVERADGDCEVRADQGAPGPNGIVHERYPLGTWTQILYSGSLPADQKNAVLKRVRKLQDAIKVAKEQANLLDVERQKAADAVFAFVFGE